MTWQLARIIKPGAETDATGKTIWTNGIADRCVGDCQERAMFVNHKYPNWFTGEMDGQGVIHLDELELLPIFAEDVKYVTFDEWFQMSTADVLALQIGVTS